jgi:hypothetical protein
MINQLWNWQLITLFDQFQLVNQLTIAIPRLLNSNTRIYIRLYLCFSLFCVLMWVGFEPRKLQNKQRKISFKKAHFYGNSFELYFDCKCLVMLSVNLVIILYLTLCWVFILLINEKDQIFVMFDVHTMYIGSFVF